MTATGPLLLLLLGCKSAPEPPPPAPILLPREDLAEALAVTTPPPPPPPLDLEAITREPTPTPERAAAYAAVQPKTVVELQQWRESRSVTLPAEQGGLTATLVDLNPYVHEWFLVQLAWPEGRTSVYHLENASPGQVRVGLDPAAPTGLQLVVDGQAVSCPLWGEGVNLLETARTSGSTYAPICEGRLAVRNPTEGRRSAREAATDFLRDKVWGGEKITTLVKETVYQDSDLVTSELVEAEAAAFESRQGAPQRAAVAADVVGRHVVPVNLGLTLEHAPQGTVEVGRWYPVAGASGTWLSAMEPRFVDPAVTEGWGERVHPLDPVEASALVYVTAFDLSQLEVVFDNGTDHTRVGWSERVLPAVRDARLPGPDGFDKLGPLVRTGKVNPAVVPRLVATCTGGFKRSHGAFRHGDLALRNAGSHYGWIEHGVVESKLQPGLATLTVDVDGEVDLVVWQDTDGDGLWRYRAARQNGVPITQPGPDGRPEPGELVTSWSGGNWSGSVEGKLRSVRASVCVQDTERGRFLLYGYFSSATPSAMARVLAAYGCGVSMLTDMNALEHTYMTVHALDGGHYHLQHLIRGMEVLDRDTQGVYLPRFVGLADNRDFFTILRRQP